MYPLLALVLLVPAAAAQTGAGQSRPAGSAPASVRPAPDLADRVEALERRLGASALFDLVARIDRLAREIQQLRDRVEVQGRALDDLRDRQRDLYAELDRLFRRAPPAAGSSSPAGAGSGGDSFPVREESVPGGEVDLATGTGRGEASAGAPAAEPEPAGGGVRGYDPVEEQARFQLAFDLLSEGNFERAAGAFAGFRADFPDSRYVDDAWFWQGECLYAIRRFEPALEEFRALIDHHPDSPKVPGAQLKIGFILHELGRSGEAVEVLEALAEALPESSEAKLARDRLEYLK